MMMTNWHHDAAQERGESIPSLQTNSPLNADISERRVGKA